MSFAIIRNTKYKRENLKGIYRHNERKNKNYSNDNIDKEKSYLPQTRYWIENYGSSAEEIDYSFTLLPELTDLKRRHLAGYTSQMSAKEFPLILSDEDFTELFGTEYLKK